jgi:hypothetical protein
MLPSWFRRGRGVVVGVLRWLAHSLRTTTTQPRQYWGMYGAR